MSIDKLVIEISWSAHQAAERESEWSHLKGDIPASPRIERSEQRIIATFHAVAGLGAVTC